MKKKAIGILAVILCIAILLPVGTRPVMALSQQEKEDIYRVDHYRDFAYWNLLTEFLLNSDYFVYHRVTIEQSFTYQIANWDNADEMKKVVACLLELSEQGIKSESKNETYCKILSSYFSILKDDIDFSFIPVTKVSKVKNAIKEVSDFYLKEYGVNTAVKLTSGDINYEDISKQVLDRCDGLTDNEAVSLRRQFERFSDSSAWLDEVKSFSKALKVTTKVLDIAKKSMSMLAEIESYKITNDRILVLLQDIADHTSSSTLKTACLDLKRGLTQTYDDNLIDGVSKIVADELIDYTLDLVKDKIYESFGLAGVMAKLGIECGKAVSNALFNTDEQVTLMKSIWCINEVSETLVPLIRNNLDDYYSFSTINSDKANKASFVIYYLSILQGLREKGEDCYYNLQIKARSSAAVENFSYLDFLDLTGIKKGDAQVEAWYYQICKLLSESRSVLFGSIDPLCYLESAPEETTDNLPQNVYDPIPDGIYTFRNCNSQKMLNVYAGTNADGTKLVTWDFDGTTDQRFFVKHIGNGQYVFYAVSSATSSGSYSRCLDAYTGSSPTLPSAGDTLDIWIRKESWNKRQLFYITPVGTGEYVISLCFARDLVITADSPSKNGGTISVRKYAESSAQKWTIGGITGGADFKKEYANTYINTGDGALDIVNVASTQVGYVETSATTGEPVFNGNSKWYTKYGARFGDSSGAWCAYFVMWCAEQASIPKSVIPQSRPYGNCGTMMDWFKANSKWKDPYVLDKDGDYADYYSPLPGDIVFFDWDKNGTPDHVGIFSRSFWDETIECYEGNVCADVDGIPDTTGYYQVVRNIRTNDNILGYGTYEYQGNGFLNGTAIAGGTHNGKAYMLSDTKSESVWYVDIGDRCEVLCKDGDYYLLLYPFLNTGKYVAAYVPTSIVDITGTVPTAMDYYNINKEVLLKGETVLYHNPSTESLRGDSGLDNKVRAKLNSGDTVTVLFEKDGFYFVKTDSVSGFAEKSKIDLQNVPGAGDNSPDTPDPPSQPTDPYPQEDFIAGDTDGDGKLSETDGQLILKHCAKLIKLTDEQLLRADADGNGKVNAADAAKIFRYLKNSKSQ